MDMSLSKLQEIAKDREPGMLQPMGLQTGGHNLPTEQQPQETNTTYVKWLYSNKN